MKIIVSLLTALLVSLSSSAQTWAELDESFHGYLNDGDYKRAAIIGEKVIIAAKKELGENDPEYAGNLNDLALVYKILVQYTKAELLFIRAMNILKKTLGDDHPEFAKSLINLAGLYAETGRYAKAETYYIRGNEIRKKELGEDDPAYAEGLDNLGQLYGEMGEYAKAEPIYIQAMDIRKKALGENDPQYAASLANLSDLYQVMGQPEKSERFALQAIDIRKKILGEDDPDYASSLNNLASLYGLTGRYEKAESLFIQALKIWKKILGEGDANYANCLGNLANLYCDMEQYAKAEPLFIQSMGIIKKAMGRDNPTYAMCLQNLGALYFNMKKYAKAEPFYLQAKEIYKSSWGENNPDYAMILDNLSGLYTNMGQYPKAEPFYLMASKIVFENTKNDFTILSEKEKGDYLNNNVTILESNNSFIYKYRRASASLIRNNFNQLLFFKSLTLADTRNMLASIQQSSDTAVQRLFTNWQTAKRLLAQQYALPIADRIPDAKKIEIQTEDLEKELSRKSAAFLRQQKAMSISLIDVQKGLQEDEVAIEFVSFNLYINEWSDSIIYAAYILHKNDIVPAFVPLFEDKQLQQLLNKSATIAFNSDVDNDEKETVRVDSLYGRKELYDLVWRPLEPYLKGVKEISYSPAGKLCGIAFHALRVDSNTLLMDKYRLQQYTSTRQVALRNSEDQTVKPSGIALFGDANFSMDSSQLVAQRTNQSNSDVSTSIHMPSTRGDINNSWPNLAGTAEEVKKIEDLFDQNKLSTRSFTQTKASEGNLKGLNGNSPQVLHVATHGFFLPEPDKKKKEKGFDKGNTYTLADDPLLRSGLILAGGNYAWSGKKPIDGVEDGIATAYEISQLNLSNTELVVLSACETALGDIKGSEGVFGLQRAFKMAGVKKMIVSLWKVPDKETSELMIAFYGYWLKGKTIDEAFAQAQADMRKEYSPFYWAAFVLIE